MNIKSIPMPLRRAFLAFEFSLIFIGLPLLVLFLKDRVFMLTLLWGGAIVVLYTLYTRYGRAHRAEWNIDGLRAGIKDILLRFVVLAPLITLAAWFSFRGTDQFLSMPRDRTDLWIRIMIFYPLLSVWPQEIIYRSFIYHRYSAIFGAGIIYILASALSFGFMHIIFLNPVALLMTLVGGFLFSSSYARHKSLALACLEHALYGCLIFSIGLGHYFFSGAAWQ